MSELFAPKARARGAIKNRVCDPGRLRGGTGIFMAWAARGFREESGRVGSYEGDVMRRSLTTC